MFCPHCGSQNSNTARTCTACGMPFDNPYQSNMAGAGPVGSDANIPSYLVQAILCTICCCMPFGVVAIVYAAQVDGKKMSGDYQGARLSSDSAKMWCWISLGIGLVGGLLWCAAVFSGAMMPGGFHR